jgi:uncharacterized protein involved in type VI secretion and phage assembly
MPEKIARLFSSPKVAQRIARRSGQQMQTVAARMIGKKDVSKLVAGIFQAQKSSHKMSMALD